jgi:hypothetical protein
MFEVFSLITNARMICNHLTITLLLTNNGLYWFLEKKKSILWKGVIYHRQMGELTETHFDPHSILSMVYE